MNCLLVSGRKKQSWFGKGVLLIFLFDYSTLDYRQSRDTKQDKKGCEITNSVVTIISPCWLLSLWLSFILHHLGELVCSFFLRESKRTSALSSVVVQNATLGGRVSVCGLGRPLGFKGLDPKQSNIVIQIGRPNFSARRVADFRFD